jgi:hypothetical protein
MTRFKKMLQLERQPMQRQVSVQVSKKKSTGRRRDNLKRTNLTQRITRRKTKKQHALPRRTHKTTA